MLPALFVGSHAQMHHLVISSLWVASLVTATAQAPAAAQTAEVLQAGQASLKEAALDNLLSERTSLQALDTAIADARKHGVSEQAILEARFLFHVDRNEDEAIAKLAPEFIARRAAFKPADTAIFSENEDWLAVVEYVQAIAALRDGNKDAFKQHITEAFWLSPGQAAAFAPHIERMRLAESMRSVKVDLNTSFPSLHEPRSVLLKDLMKDKKALLLHFWSPMSEECEAAMPDFIATAKALVGKDIGCVSLIPDNDAEQANHARKMIGSLPDKDGSIWLIDSTDHPLGRLMRIKNLPTMVILSPEGTVLFNGHPTDDEFWNCMNRVDPRIGRPQSAIETGK